MLLSATPIAIMLASRYSLHQFSFCKNKNRIHREMLIVNSIYKPFLLHQNRSQIYDSYADINGSYWNLCKLSDEIYRDSSALLLPSPIHITSYLNSLHIRQKTTDSNHLKLNASVRVQPGIWLDLNLYSWLSSEFGMRYPCHPSLSLSHKLPMHGKLLPSSL